MFSVYWCFSDEPVTEDDSVFATGENKSLRYDTGLQSSVCVVACAFIMAVSVYQISKTKAEI